MRWSIIAFALMVIRHRERDPMRRWRPIRVSFAPGAFGPALVTRRQVLLAATTAVAAGFAWSLALTANPHSRPYFAPLAVLLVVQPTVYDSISRAF